MALNDNQRKLWAEKLMDLANLSAGALIFGSLLSESKIEIWLVAVGIILYFSLSATATTLMRR